MPTNKDTEEASEAEGPRHAVSEDEGTELRHDVTEEDREAALDERLTDLIPANRKRPRANLPLTHDAVLTRGLSYRTFGHDDEDTKRPSS